MTEIAMPRLSDSMESGTIVRWLKGDGDTVARGDELAEIETDKATMTYEANAGGVLRILVPEGATVDVGAPIAALEHDAPAAGAASPQGIPADATVASPPYAPVNAATTAGNGLRATPLARRVAADLGVNLASVRGSGPRGRVTRRDVASAAGRSAAGTTPIFRSPAEPAPSLPRPSGAATEGSPTGRGRTTVHELSRLQRVVARRMTEAKATIPEFTVQAEVDMARAVALREDLRRLLKQPPSLNDLIVKAAARALVDHPRANGSFLNDRFELHERVNVGIAVASGDGLVVPTIFDADRRSLSEIAGEARRLAERVRCGTVEPAELEGGTFTVSNLGMFGMSAITPVINPPQAAILGVGAIREQLGLVDGEVRARPWLTLTLTCDHRILYGADAARFLSDICELLREPLATTL